jgi:hypothetical protein
MTDPNVLAAAAILRSHDIRFVVVGGQAVARSVSTGTSDVDVMVTTSAFDRTLAALLKDPRLRLRGLREGLALFAVESARGVGLDILDAAPFAGNRTGEEFFTYLTERESSEKDGIRYASTALVWYTRLLATRWRAYAEKVLVNIQDGADAGEFQRVEAIAREFGTASEVLPRIEYVRKELADRLRS